MPTTKYTTDWNFDLLEKNTSEQSFTDAREIIKTKSYEFINKWKNRTDYLEDPKILKNALDEYETWMTEYSTDGNEGFYYHLKSSLDENDPATKAKLNQVTNFAMPIENDIEFFTLRLSKISEDKQRLFLNSGELAKYHSFLKSLFNAAKYLLSEPEEKIMNMKSIPAHANWVRMLSGFLAKSTGEVQNESGKQVTKTFPEIQNLMNSTKKEIRDSAAKAFNKILGDNLDVAENELNSILYDKKINDELRNMPRPDAGRHLSDDIESEVVDTLLDTVSQNFRIAKDYYKLKARLMGVKKLEYHERNVPLGAVDKRYPYEKSIDTVQKTFAKLDPEFAEILNTFATTGHIDVFPKQGKSSGAFCTHNTIKQPVYVLLNHTDRLTDVLTIAHEMGHAINNELMRKSVTEIYYGVSLAVAEVASTFMEDFVLEDIRAELNDEDQLSLLMEKLNDDISTIFRQVAAYKFEQELHATFREKAYLAKEDIGKIFAKHMKSYMGEFVEYSKGSENWWVYWSHFRTFFYVYSYASGLLISKSMQSMVRENPAFISTVKEFLAEGGSVAPKAAFTRFGIDITNAKFWQKGIDEIQANLYKATKMAKKLGKI